MSVGSDLDFGDRCHVRLLQERIKELGRGISLYCAFDSGGRFHVHGRGLRRIRSGPGKLYRLVGERE
jgi:hypothetical protein